ncbi:MAG: DUF4124 domain-containing protein [Gammaproteobacteria bacterium]|nr:DUF4124 domain-containing protein [Gammaproteobacteria bacterium]
MKYIPLVLLFVAMTVHAAFYRSIDEYGNVVYSDQPSANSEQIELKELSTYTPTPIVEVEAVTDANDAESTDIDVPDYQISISTPKQNEAFWSNGGTVDVTATVQPELSAERNDQLLFLLDGKPVGQAQSDLTIRLDNVERGSHILVVTVVDSQGKILQRSKSVLFHLHKRSIAQ